MVKVKRAKYIQLRLPALCEGCGKPLEHPARADKRFCSTACRVRKWRKQHAS